MQKDLIIRKVDLRTLNILLTKLVDSSRIDLAILINKSGRMLTFQSETSDFDKTSLAALISGNFASRNSIANLLGEEEFSSMLQEGTNRHIYISLVDDHNILATVFDQKQKLEKIKQVIEQFKPYLKERLDVIYSNIGLNPDLNFDVN